jgi:hypothetical protein
MRKPIRSFVVETTKSRHEQRSMNGRASFVTMLADAEPKFRDHPAFNLTREPEPASTTTLERPAPKRVLEALASPSAAPEPALPEPIERKRGRPRKHNPDSDALTSDEEERPLRSERTAPVAARIAAPAVKTRSVVEAPVARKPVTPPTTLNPSSDSEQAASAIMTPGAEAQTAPRRQSRSEANGGLKPGQRWMAHLPKATQKRLLGRPRNAR